jgi:hypothetical protein
LERNAFRLRRQLAKLTGSKFTPYLRFQHDHLPPQEAAVVQAMAAVEQQQQQQQQQQQAADVADAAKGHSSLSSASSSSEGVDVAHDAHVAAAVAELERSVASRRFQRRR